MKKLKAKVKAKKKPKAKAKAKAEAKATPRRWRRRPPEPESVVIDTRPILRRELRPGWELFEIPTTCPNNGHSVIVIREGLQVRAIDTPCGIAVARAEHNLGVDNCWQLIEWTIDYLKGMFRPTSRPHPVNPITGLPAPQTPLEVAIAAIGVALGGAEGDKQRFNKREARRARDQIPDWNRAELTKAASLAFIGRVAGPGTKVSVSRSGSLLVTIMYAGKPSNEWSTYHYIADSWGVGSGPQAPDVVYRALCRLGKHITR